MSTLPSCQLLGPCQPLRTALLCAGNLLAPIAVAVAEEGMLQVWMRRREAQKREKLRLARKQVEAALAREVRGAAAALAMLRMGWLYGLVVGAEQKAFSHVMREVAVGVQAGGAARRSHAVPRSVVLSGSCPANARQHFGATCGRSCAALYGMRMQTIDELASARFLDAWWGAGTRSLGWSWLGYYGASRAGGPGGPQGWQPLTVLNYGPFLIFCSGPRACMPAAQCVVSCTLSAL